MRNGWYVLGHNVWDPCLKSAVHCQLRFASVYQTYNLGEPSDSKDVDAGCSRGMARAVSFGINTNFLVAILVCIAILLSKYNSEYCYVMSWYGLRSNTFSFALLARTSVGIQIFLSEHPVDGISILSWMLEW